MSTPNPATPDQPVIPAANTPATPAAPAKPDAPAVDPVKAAVDAARVEWEQNAAKKAQADKEAAEAEAAKKRGEWEAVAKAETAKREAAERVALQARQQLALRDHLAAKAPEYLASAVDIAHHIPADADGDVLTKAIEKASADFAIRNPRTPAPRGNAGAPAHRQASDRTPATLADDTNPATAYSRRTYLGPRSLRTQRN